jgi:hypothetical protein
MLNGKDASSPTLDPAMSYFITWTTTGQKKVLEMGGGYGDVMKKVLTDPMYGGYLSFQ